MDFSEDTVICKFCLGKFTKNCAPIGEVVKHTLNFLTNLTVSDNPMMCETCAASVTKCFDFKVRCLSTEDCIASFVEGEDKKVDLRYIYANVKQEGNMDSVPDDHNVCRFCLELVKDDASVSIGHDADLIKILQKYFLELDVKITDDISACTPCYDLLQNYASFVNNYMNNEERIDEYCKVISLNYKDQVDLGDVGTFISKSLVNVEDMSCPVIKEEKIENIVDTNDDIKPKFEDTIDMEQEEKFIVKEAQEENSNSFQHHTSPSQSDVEPQTTAKSAKYICEICHNQDDCKCRLQEQNLSHKDTDLVTSYNCERCLYKTKKKDYLRRHMRGHLLRDTIGVVTQGPMNKCDQCDYETKRKSDLKKHMPIHKTPSETTTYKCETCGFQTKWKRKHREHLLSHTNTQDVITPGAMYKCNLCDFNTKWKNHLNRHMLNHKNPSEITIYKCESCTYQSRHKDYLRTHKMVHMDESKIKMHKCEECSFNTKWKCDLRKHVLTHKNAVKGGKTHKCSLCDYKAKWNCDLIRHMLIHKTPSEIAMYKCEKCSYETRHKHYLKKHLLTHMEIYKCEACPFKTKWKRRLQKHIFTHKQGGKMYKCTLCNYETKQNVLLTRHMLIHKNPSEITMYKCELCAYKTRHKGYLPKHMLIHMDESKIEMHKCDLCSFETKWKKHLRVHISRGTHIIPQGSTYKCDLCEYEAKRRCDLKRHMRSHRTRIYKCDLCDYETKESWNLKNQHMLTHKDPSEITLYKCELCHFQTKHKYYLKKHNRLVHVNASEIETYECKLCPFTSKRNSSFEKHLLTHRHSPDSVTESIMYKCDLCDYEANQESDLKGHTLTHKSHTEITIIKHELPDDVDVVKSEDAHTNS